MRTAIAVLALSQLAGVLAFPWMGAPGADEATRAYLERRANSTTISSTTPTAGNNNPHLTSLATRGATNVQASDLRPDSAHPFVAPEPSDQRGPCPGLNVMANYGYLPRNGIITAEQAISASKDVFNMDYDLGAFLSYEAVAFGGNLATGVFSIGGEDARTYSSTGIGSKEFGRQYGLDAHGRVEGDASATRQDYNLNNGDNHSGIPSWFARLVDAAKVNGGEFNHAATNALYGQNARLSLANNPTSVWQAHTIVVTLAEYGLITEFFANGTLGDGGVANYDSVAPFMGFQTNNNGTVCAVFEHFPKNWFRRSTPYGLVDGVLANLVPTFLSGPLLPNPLQDYFTSADIGGLGCALYQHFKNGLTVEMTGQSQAYTAQMNAYLQQKLLPALPSFLTCDLLQNVPQTDNATLPSSPTVVLDDSMQATGPGGEQKYSCYAGL
ncbi:hypothetical protein JCM5296_004622 [Sporobolomyces johnsonii]